MASRIVKVLLVGLMLVGIVFSLLNFVAVKSEALVIWQHLDQGTDPVLGTPYIRCWKSGQSCVVVYPFDGQ
ncbi:MAG: hypothetical protein PVH61_14660 [Candidatus Aminicenantes bacterium]|jgi:hypothetical protein